LSATELKPNKCIFQRCIVCVDIARRSSARGRQTTVRWQKQVFAAHTRLSRAYLALARLSCYLAYIPSVAIVSGYLPNWCEPSGHMSQAVVKVIQMCSGARLAIYRL